MPVLAAFVRFLTARSFILRTRGFDVVNSE